MGSDSLGACGDIGAYLSPSLNGDFEGLTSLVSESVDLALTATGHFGFASDVVVFDELFENRVKRA